MSSKGTIATLILTLSACGVADTNPNAIAQALAGPAPRESMSGHSFQDLKARAEAKAAQAKADELQSITTVSGEMPELENGCTEVGFALDEFTRKRLGDPDDRERWNATKEPDIRRVVETCMAAGKPEVAACQANALRSASLAHFSREAAGEILEHCTKRYGTPTPGV